MDVVDFAKHVYKRIREREDDLAQLLVTGGPKDWEQYKMIVGEIQGLSFAAEEMRTLLERSESYEDGFDESG
jgi:acyl-CoA reductase-like NAD-dependent aldehyde dehydrogenase